MSEFIQFIGFFLSVAIFARVIMTWFPVGGNNPIVMFIYTVTEPILAPIRRFVPRLGMFDLSPIIALVLINFIETILVRALS